jgi:hypothetical protein
MATSITRTTLAAALDNTSNTVYLTSATGVSGLGNNNLVQTYLYIDTELMAVQSVTGTVAIVKRGIGGTGVVGHVSGAAVLLGPSAHFTTFISPPTYNAAVTAANVPYTPVIDVTTGAQWAPSTVTNSWVPNWNNPLPPLPTVTVASAAGLVTPSGPLFIVSGTAAITGFNTPVGFTNGGSFTVIPTGVFTWTTANNIALAGTAVVAKALTFTYNVSTDKWYPSYIA